MRRETYDQLPSLIARLEKSVVFLEIFNAGGSIFEGRELNGRQSVAGVDLVNHIGDETRAAS